MLLELHERQDRVEQAISLPGRLEQARAHHEGVRKARQESTVPVGGRRGAPRAPRLGMGTGRRWAGVDAAEAPVVPSTHRQGDQPDAAT